MDLKQLRTIRPHITAVAVVAALLAGCAGTPDVPEDPIVHSAPPMEGQESAPQKRAIKKPVDLKPDYPEYYIVVRGDTLWDIANRFLEDPWRWPELWQNNPQVTNPHLIYPGDILTLTYIGGIPTLQVKRAGGPLSAPDLPEGYQEEVREEKPGLPVVKLSPEVRIEELDKAIPTLSLESIREFLNRPLVLDRDDLDTLPYVFDHADEHVMSGAGQKVYVRGIEREKAVYDYSFVRKGRTYSNPEDEDDILGYEAIYLGYGQLVDLGDVSTFQLMHTEREVLIGDRLKPGRTDEVNFNFMPHAPSVDVNAKIIAVVDGVNQIGQFDVVVIDAGRQKMLEPGHVLAVYQTGKVVEDRIADEEVKLPDIRAGEIVVFRVFDRVSYALVVDANRPIHTMDTITNP